MLDKGPKMIPVLGVFKFDAILSCHFGFGKKGRGWGGSRPKS